MENQYLVPEASTKQGGQVPQIVVSRKALNNRRIDNPSKFFGCLARDTLGLGGDHTRHDRFMYLCHGKQNLNV